MAQLENDNEYFINAIYILDDESNGEEINDEETDDEMEDIYHNILLGEEEYQEFTNIMSCIGLTMFFEIGLILCISQFFF